MERTYVEPSDIRPNPMISLAIAALFFLAGIIGLAVVADSLIKARAAWVRLMREGEVMRAGLALQAAAREMSLRPAPAARRAIARRAKAGRVPVPWRPLPLQACAAA